MPNQTPESDEEMKEDEDEDSDGRYSPKLFSFSLILSARRGGVC